MTTHQAARNRRILIVDDNESIHRDFQHILAGSGAGDAALAAAEAALFGDTQLVIREPFQLDSAYQGREALDMVVAARAEGRPYAMAFVDMRMPPGWDGVETIEHLWKQDPELQIAICSAYSDYSWEDMANRLELRDRLLILKKPFDNIEIYQLASALTAKWQMAREASTRLLELESAVEARTRELRMANAALQAEMNERQRLEGQLALRQKLEGIGQLAAGLAHEINTPIQYIGDNLYFLRSACAELCALQDRYEQLLALEPQGTHQVQAYAAVKDASAAADLELLRSEIPQSCERALSGVERVARIVRAMREFSHPTDHEKEPADINAALESTLLVAHNEYKLVAKVETEFSELPAVTCNISELNQAFLNVIVNAAHAVHKAGRDPADGRIRVRTSADEEYVTVSVSDNGIGIAPSIAHKVFDPFFTTKEVGKGTGQGLSMTHAIVVANHRGTLSFESKEREGTTFVIRVPIMPPTTVPQADAASSTLAEVGAA